MGFKRKPYKLVWPDDSIWAGLEVSIRGMDFAELEEISQVRNAAEGQTSFSAVKPLLVILQNALIGWNFEDETGNPVPISEFQKQDVAMLLAIVQGWQGVIGSVPTPLSQSSSDGGKSPEEQIPMEIPSASLPNSNGQS